MAVPKDDRKSWTIEQEGRVAQLLRGMAACERAEERESLTEDLQELTGLEFGANLSKWLAWYLEDHLGMRNALGILSGRIGGNVTEPGLPLRMEEVVFDCAEYNWCALDRIDNKDDMLKLRMLYSDLESPVLVEAEGPFSFRRLTSLDPDDLSFFSSKSISQALFSEAVQVRHLRVMKDYGKMMMVPLFPEATQRAGAILYAGSICQALVKFDNKITSLSYADLAESLPGLLDRPYLVESYAKLFREALEKCR